MHSPSASLNQVYTEYDQNLYSKRPLLYMVYLPFVRLEDEAPEEVLLDVHRHVAAELDF